MPADPTLPEPLRARRAAGPADRERVPSAALRLALAPEGRARLERHPLLVPLRDARRSRVRPSRRVYWDTPDLALAAAGLALRLERSGAQVVQTVETASGVGLAAGLREEHHALVASERPEPDRVPDRACRARLLAAAAGRPLAPVFEVRLERTRHALREAPGAVRLDVEVGEIHVPGAVIPVCDVEIASPAGDPARAFDLALALLDAVRLRPMPRSVAERAVERIGGRSPGIHAARRPVLSPRAALDDLVAAVGASCLAQIVENEPAAWLGVDPEGVHQMRVGARRLRAALGFFAPVLPETESRALREELRWLAGVLGPARDLDVLVLELLEPLRAERPSDAPLARLCEAAEDARREARAAVREALAGPRSPRLALAAGAWIARRAWREPAGAPAPLFAPAHAWAAGALERRHRRARKLGRRLARATPEERHRLRIRLKKLRYAAEFVASLDPGRRARRYTRRLARLQDALGRLNDAANAERQLAALLARMEGGAQGDAARAAGFAAGWAAHAARAELARLPKRWARFADAPRFWRRPPRAREA